MTRPPDFELQASLRAHHLKVNTQTSASVDPNAPEVRLEKRRQRANVPDELENGETYADVEICHEVVGRLRRT